MIEFFLHIPPPRVTHQQKKVAVVNGRPRFYEPQRLKEARQAFMLALYPNRPGAPLNGPLGLFVRWQFKRGRHRDGDYKTTRPDLDNMEKLLKDCMTGAEFWHDDSQVGIGRDLETAPAGAPLSVYERQLEINKNIIGGNAV